MALMWEIVKRNHSCGGVRSTLHLSIMALIFLYDIVRMTAYILVVQT